MSTKALILSGEGINCTQETANAFVAAGAKSICIDVHTFLSLESLDEYDILVFPGGFSFGDEIKSGKILQSLIRIHQKNNILKFAQDNKPILGICNGFQILLQLGLFDNDEKNLTLSENKSAQFINRWVGLKVSNEELFWFKNMPTKFDLPIRHKEGRLMAREKSLFYPALQYDEDINGSFDNIAALTNSQGNVLGMMPHPEAAINELLHPFKKDKKNQPSIILQLFINAVEHRRNHS